MKERCPIPSADAALRPQMICEEDALVCTSRTILVAFPLIIWSFRIFERPPSIRMRILTPSFFPLEMNEELLRMMMDVQKSDVWRSYSEKNVLQGAASQ